MATEAVSIPRTGLAPLRSDRLLGYVSILMLVVVLAAIARGHDHWREAPPMVWLHLGLLIPALALTPIILAGAKGHGRHRLLGWIWVVLMSAVALASFLIPIGPGRSVSPIWLIAIFVLAMTPRLVLAARGHRIAQHRRTARGMVIGAVLVAGFFTLPFGRMLGRWLFGG